MTSTTLNGHDYSTDGSADRDMVGDDGYGYQTWLIPMFQDALTDFAAKLTNANSAAAAAGSALPVIKYGWDNGTTDADPGAGKLRANNATLSSATTLYLSTSDMNSVDVSSIIGVYDDSTSTVKGYLAIGHRTDPTKWVIYSVGGSVVTATGYRKVTVAYVAGPGGFSAADPVAVGFVRNGDKGDTGATGATGTNGVDGTNKVCEGGTAGGTENALTCTASPAAILARGVAISLQTGSLANTGAATLNANSLGAVTIQKNGSALVAGDLPASTRVLLVYDGTYWQLSGGGGFTAATASDAATGTSTTLAVTPSALSGWTNALTELTPGNVDQANDFLPIWDTSASAMRKVRASALATVASTTTWNPSDKYSAMTLSNGNLTASINLSQGSVRATNSIAAGKYYWEVVCINVGGAIIGIMLAAGNLGSYPGNDAYGYAYEAYVGKKVNGNTEVAYGSVCVNGDVVGIAVDAINGKIWFRVNGVWQGGGDPTAGTSAAYTGIAGSFFPAFGSGSGSASPSVTARFSPGSWSSPAPTGFTYIA
ncbi:hypothetical protein E6C67_08475 [Azospirillum sp. TSA2s]|uniref:SPRY domain-containing protein n=1 Tax=Azospirillum sp. TSA2s TaxID=709810 RepID=UPI0010AAB191|nr:SPRY domain-containing protein [Azospirillum sp. TSA2s]QCG93973.1 hypothetical protein E6C67_08475 [Azospirillum sp. TSA2s]